MRLLNYLAAGLLELVVGCGPSVSDMHTHPYTVQPRDTLWDVCEIYIDDTNMYDKNELMYETACKSDLDDLSKLKIGKVLNLFCDGGPNCPGNK